MGAALWPSGERSIWCWSCRADTCVALRGEARPAEQAQGLERLNEYPDWPNLPTLMFSRARQWPDRPMLRFHRDGAWNGVTWGEFARRAASVARELRASGVAAGDRVLMVSES